MVQYHPNGDWTVFDRKPVVTDEQRQEYARAVEGDSDNPLRVREANLILEGQRDADVERFAASNKGGRDGE